ncbi:hypothetical protein PENSPDRAFT_671552 [Peniophora sp. CONT]|nr:hypothetical protein PENSPDRAFT_671552 [Peniophora sp. CONT]
MSAHWHFILFRMLLQSGRLLHPGVLYSMHGSTVINGLVELDWFGANWLLDENNTFRFRDHNVQLALPVIKLGWRQTKRLYLKHPDTLKITFKILRDQLDAVLLFRQACMHNDRPVMMLAACHIMYIKAIMPVSHTSPLSSSGLQDLYAAHFTKDDFQQTLLAAAKCDMNSWNF